MRVDFALDMPLIYIMSKWINYVAAPLNSRVDIDCNAMELQYFVVPQYANTNYNIALAVSYGIDAQRNQAVQQNPRQSPSLGVRPTQNHVLLKDISCCFRLQSR